MRYLAALLLTGVLLHSLTNALPAQSQRRPFRELLAELKLSADQKTQVAKLFRDYRGKYRTDAFRVALLGVLTAEQAETLEQLVSANRPGPNLDDAVIERDIAYDKKPGVDPKFLSLDIYRKKGEEDKKRPVMVMIHGGGWRIGDKSNRSVGADKARYFLDQGFVYVTMNYRLSPAVHHPAHVADVAAAVAWVHDHIAQHGGDPNQIFIMGHSAGAHLAALVSTDDRRLKAHDQPLSIIKGTILLDGAGYDVAAQMKFARVATSGMYRDAFTDDKSVQQDASPIRHVAPGKGIPPFLIIPIASRPDSRLQSQRLAKALTDTGVEAKVSIAEGKTHGSLNTDIGKPDDEPTAVIAEFLRKQRQTLASK